MRELLARVARELIGTLLCVISDYSARALAMARRMRAVVVADRPSPAYEQMLEDARDAGEIEALHVVDITGDRLPAAPGVPARPRHMVLTNGRHSSREALAYDLHVRGLDPEAIGDLMGVDAETARTFVRRAEKKNRIHPAIDSLLQQIALANRQT